MQTVITRCSYKTTIKHLKDNYSLISDDGCFFAIVSTEYNKSGDVKYDFLDVICTAVKLGYIYVNTIVYPTTNVQDVAFSDNVRYVVWLCKNHDNMKFNKDVIREKHIWKDVEWGKREKNYNPKGKDPGNVWIPTEDNGHAVITKHILLSDEEVKNKIISMSNCGNDFKYYSEELPLFQQSIKQVDINTKASNKAKVIFSSAEKMGLVKNGSIKLGVTSPPYWDLKDYFKEGQIGQEPYDVYLKRMRKVWENVYKKLTPDGSLWININIRNHDNNVILIPKDFVKICKDIGFHYKGIIIWHKSSGIPTNNKNIVDRHEYVLIFSKDKRFVANRKMLTQFCDYKNDTINSGAFWNINRKAGSVGKKYIHPAIYPNELVRRIVVCATHPGDTVIDPFLGSGTTVIATCNSGRNCIGYEYYEGFKDLMESRYKAEMPDVKVKYISSK